MLESQNNFILESKIACDNEHKKNILSKNLDNYYKKWNTSKNIFADLDVAKKKVHYAKYKSIENLEKNIIDFEKNFTELGGKVLYAPSKKEALSYILQILNEIGRASCRERV